MELRRLIQKWNIGRIRTAEHIIMCFIQLNYDVQIYICIFVSYVRYHIFKSHAYWHICFPFLLVPQTTLHIATYYASWRIVCYLTSSLGGWLLTIYIHRVIYDVLLSTRCNVIPNIDLNLHSDTIPDINRIVLCASMITTQGVRCCSYLPFVWRGRLDFADK